MISKRAPGPVNSKNILNTLRIRCKINPMNPLIDVAFLSLNWGSVCGIVD